MIMSYFIGSPKIYDARIKEYIILVGIWFLYIDNVYLFEGNFKTLLRNIVLGDGDMKTLAK